MAEIKENNIEWYTGQDRVTVSFSQKKYVNRIKNMAEKHPSCVEIIAENEDGSIYATIPLRAVHLTIYDQKKPGFKGVDDDERTGISFTA